VPADPAVKGSQSDFFFSSLEPSSGASILQPVLQWGTSAAGGGQGYFIASWYVAKNHQPYVNAATPVGNGDVIYGQLEGNSCASNGSSCHWTVVATDLTTGSVPVQRIDVTAGDIFNQVQGGVFESYGATSCAMFPASHTAAFSSIQVWGPTFNPLTPSWRVQTGDQECSMNVSASASTTTITWAG
jgi:hypothetical protein